MGVNYSNELTTRYVYKVNRKVILEKNIDDSQISIWK